MSKSRKTKKIEKIVVFIIIVIASIFYGMYQKYTEVETFIPTNETKLELFYFDVGQADSSLVMNDGMTMLIDGGNDSDGDTLVKNLHSLRVEKIDYLVATHMHADHIGGLDTIIDNFDIGLVLMPETSKTDKQVEELLISMKNKGLPYELVQTGDSFSLGNAQCEIMHIDNTEPSNLNLSSIVIQVEFGNQNFLFMGDAEKEVEESRKWNKATILKAGHHGSDTSSSKEFLLQVQPEVTILSVGKNNTYKHPSQSVLDRLANINTTIYRTDTMGTIWITSDGTNYTKNEFKKAEVNT